MGKRPWLVLFLAMLLAGGIYWGTSLAAGPRITDYDTVFLALRTGMTRQEIEAVLGPPTGPAPSDTESRIVGFRAVDSLPIAKYGLKMNVRVWWYNGGERCIYVDYRDGKLLRAKLFGPGSEKWLGPDKSSETFSVN